MQKTTITSEEIKEIVNGLSHLELKRIKETIGPGYIKKLKARLFEVKGVKHNDQYLRNCFITDNLKAPIVFEALLMAQEIEEGKTQSIEKARSFLSKNRPQ
jgi:hypothetical protein